MILLVIKIGLQMREMNNNVSVTYIHVHFTGDLISVLAGYTLQNIKIIHDCMSQG